MTDLTPEQMVEKILQSLRRTGDRFARSNKKKTSSVGKRSRTVAHRAPTKVQDAPSPRRAKG
jgi:trimethylamine:corrinoid methyltransferase-like protein